MKLEIWQILLLGFLIGNLSVLYCQTKEESIERKADFILLAASKISFSQNDTNDVYRIGIYGREKDVISIYKDLIARSPEIKIHKKPLEVLLFRKTKSITPVDIFYVNGQSKIRISEIDEKLKNCRYLILTENFPFGTSVLNFAVNKGNNVHFEIQPELIWDRGGKISNKFLNASNRVHTKENWEALLQTTSKQLHVKTQIAERQKEVIEKQTEVIVKQTEQIVDQSEQIDYQQIIIYVVCGFLLVVIALTYFLARINQKRKLANKQLAIKNKEITDSIRYARLIQSALLPKLTQISNAFSDGFVLNIPKDIVSGDFYWYEEFDDVAALAVVDGAGHGVPGALMSIMGNELFRFVLNGANVKKTGLVLQLIDNKIKESFHIEGTDRAEGMDIVLIAYHRNSKQIYYSGANRPLVLVRNGELTIMEPTRKSLGGQLNQRSRYFETTRIETEPNDIFYLFTDGYQDQFGGESGKKFSRKRLYSLLLENSEIGMDEQRNKIFETLISWKGKEEQVDDICVVGVRV